MRTDSEMLDWLEDNHSLHRSVDILYVVDGYEVSVTHDSTPLHVTVRGDNLRDAISKAMEVRFQIPTGR